MATLHCSKPRKTARPHSLDILIVLHIQVRVLQAWLGLEVFSLFSFCWAVSHGGALGNPLASADSW